MSRPLGAKDKKKRSTENYKSKISVEAPTQLELGDPEEEKLEDPDIQPEQEQENQPQAPKKRDRALGNNTIARTIPAAQIAKIKKVAFYHLSKNPMDPNKVVATRLPFIDQGGNQQTILVDWQAYSDEGFGRLVGGGPTRIVLFGAIKPIGQIDIELPGPRRMHIDGIFTPKYAVGEQQAVAYDHLQAQMPVEAAEGMRAVGDPVPQESTEMTDSKELPQDLLNKILAQTSEKVRANGTGMGALPSVFGPIPYVGNLTPMEQSISSLYQWALHREREQHDRMLSYQEAQANARLESQQQYLANMLQQSLDVSAREQQTSTNFMQVILQNMAQSQQQMHALVTQFTETTQKIMEQFSVAARNEEKPAWKLLRQFMANNTQLITEEKEKLNKMIAELQEKAAQSQGKERDKYLEWASLLMNHGPQTVEAIRNWYNSATDNAAKLEAMRRYDQLSSQGSQPPVMQNNGFSGFQQPPVSQPVSQQVRLQPAVAANTTETNQQQPLASPEQHQVLPDPSSPPPPEAQDPMANKTGFFVSVSPEELQKLQGKPFAVVPQPDGGCRVVTLEEFARLTESAVVEPSNHVQSEQPAPTAIPATDDTAPQVEFGEGSTASELIDATGTTTDIVASPGDDNTQSG